MSLLNRLKILKKVLLTDNWKFAVQKDIEDGVTAEHYNKDGLLFSTTMFTVKLPVKKRVKKCLKK